MDSRKTVTALYEPRAYQVPAFNAILSGEAKRVITVWHRRGGKDVTAFNALWVMAARAKGNYGYFFPFATQGRKAIWNGITSESISFRDFIPKELVKNTHDTDMRITLTNDSTIQFIGTDNIDAKMGSNFLGVVMSEYPIQNPQAWDYIEPILKLNGGWAWFPFTPRGKHNHGYTLYEAGKRLAARGEPWHVELLTILDTGLLKDSDLDDLRERGVQEEFIQQEYYCNFGVTNWGSFFGRQINELEEKGRMSTAIQWDPSQLVHTSWDFGINDSTCIWFIQRHGTGWKAIDYYENSSLGIEHYSKYLKDKPYTYGTHLAPHDVRKRDLQTGMQLDDFALTLGIDFTKVDRTEKQDQRNRTHTTLPIMWFAYPETEYGVSCLANYERKWDEDLKVFSNTATHNWASHGTDAFMNFAIGKEQIRDWKDESSLVTSSDGSFDPRDYRG